MTVTPTADGATNPTPATPTAATENAAGNTRWAPNRVINQPPAAVAMTLAALNSASASAVRATGRPTGASNVGAHEEFMTRTPNATNEAVHNNAVGSRWPTVKSRPTGPPPRLATTSA